MHPSWNEWLELGRAALSAPQLSRADKARRGVEDPKWRLGDLLLTVPEHLVEPLARELGETKASFQRLREVAERWPQDQRIAASWSAHRDLKDHPDRFTLIRPGMSVREAAGAAGKKPIDAKPVERMTPEERAAHAIALLLDKEVNDLVAEDLKERKLAKRIEKAQRQAADERSAQYKQAMRELHEAQAAQSPEAAFLKAVFRIREAAEYCRAVYDAAVDEDAPLVPEHRKPDLIDAIAALVQVAATSLAALKGEVSARVRAEHGVVIDVYPENIPDDGTAQASH